MILFFRRLENHKNSAWQVFWAPLLALTAMSITIILVINNLQILSGSDSKLVQLIPWFIAACSAAGYVMSVKRKGRTLPA